MALSHCCFCSMQCGLEIEVGDGEWTAKPRKDFPVSTGRLCQKGFHAPLHVFHESRVLTPRRRLLAGDGRSKWEEAGWDASLEQIAGEIGELQAKYGMDSMAVFGGGSLTNELCYLLGKFARVALQTPYIDYNGRYCMSSAAAAGNKAFGIDRGMTMPLEEIERADCLILAGTNIAECQPTMMPYLLAAKKRGAFIVTVDPRNTPTSKLADVHIRLQPGFDSVFVNGLLHVMIEENLVNLPFIQTRVEGFDELKEAVQDYTPDRVEAWTGVMAAVVRTVARKFAAAATGIVMTARGIEQQTNGVDNTLNYINLSLVTGKIGRSGCGYGAITGQANGQGGREHGQKADQLPGYRSIQDPAAREHVSAVWGIQADSLPGPGVSAYELFEKIDRGEIKGLLVLGSNPVVSSPNSTLVKRALRKLKLLVVIDLFETETARLAHWLVPGSSFMEAEGTLTNLEGRVFYRERAMEPLRGNPEDFQILCKLAELLGKGAYFPYSKAEDIFTELRRASAGGKADYQGITYAKLKENHGVFWPCPEESHSGTPMMFTDTFAHPDGKARLHGIVPQLPAEPADRRYPYVLTTGRLANHYLSGAQTRRTDPLNKKAPQPVAEIHPSVAERLKLKLNSRLRLTSRRGTMTVAFKVSEGIHPSTVFLPFHWGDEQSVNLLTVPALDPISRMPEFKICAVQIERLDDEAEDDALMEIAAERQ
ncbi:assimilatory nitrate reductase catalytic subunit [Xylanibacillus composti]|uniref:Assimilatory nitrate reductase catalytic subunit n=1 Tax=Xylanibacillus composti TaxID=1572762 RepID=A0A8J4M442_9BACL|nr:molybdopterin oxidoreductase family protein [Xylanibacillus composti]GIQ70161.1 assimilatory nitrate reductase catalytic subunit [Xylanibacillus composti]